MTWLFRYDSGNKAVLLTGNLKPFNMKQPELGKKISELRKAKGLTQEELVEKCNISVRTIQRIESGEVTPRSYTIKTILAALDYNHDSMSDEEGLVGRITGGFRRFFFWNIDESRPSDFLINQFTIAWIWGLVYFLTGFAEATAEYFRYEEERIIVGKFFYIAVKAVTTLAYVYFQRGFILMGNIFRNDLLKIISFFLIFGNILVAAYDIASLYYWPKERAFVLGAEGLTFGGIGIVYGVSLMKMKPFLGRVSNWAGVFEIIAAAFFLTLIFAFIGFIVLIPAEIFEVIMLFKAAELIKARQNDLNT